MAHLSGIGARLQSQEAEGYPVRQPLRVALAEDAEKCLRAGDDMSLVTEIGAQIEKSRHADTRLAERGFGPHIHIAQLFP